MFRFKCNPICGCAAIAIWTIIQTGLHLSAIVYLLWWRNCNGDESNDNMYLTYFFTRECENDTGDSLQMNRNLAVNILSTNFTNNTALNNSLDNMILIYLLLDGLWIITAVALLTGALFDIRELWALLFYVPWIMVAAIILFFDVFCAIFFGLQIPREGNFFDWLNFIGINIHLSDIKKLEGDMSSLVTGAASIIMTFVSARGVVIWVINLVVMVYVIRATVQIVKKKPPPKTRNARRYASFSAEERIRKWHQFYGSMEDRANRRRSSLREDIFDISEEVESTSDVASVSSNVHADGRQVSNTSLGLSARSVMSPECRKKIEQLQLGELRGQLPWSYVDGQCTAEAIRPDVVPEKSYVKLSDVDVHESASKF